MAPMIDESSYPKGFQSLSGYEAQGNDPKDQLLPPCTVVDLFEHQVLLHPFDIAVEMENEASISFSRLKLLSNRIASSLPVQPGLIIPICMDRSVELIAGILGVLISGAAYVILDPTGSHERNKFIVEEVQASIVLTSKKYSGLYSGAVAIEDLIDEPASRRRRSSSYTCNYQRYMDPTSPAYVIYTSGTTGKPKGVVISHAAASYGIHHFSLRGNTRCLLFFNPVFSAAQRTILATLCKGGCVCLTTKARLATSLLEVIRDMRIDSLGVTPSMLATLSPKDIPSCLKQITTVGEPISISILDSWAELVDLRVSYGLSECAQLNFARTLTKYDNPSLVGRPNDTTDAFILVPETTSLVSSPGQAGELCLAGPQLSDGYLNRPIETARSFVQNPFGPGPMFRTGDLAIQDSNGNIEILGRLDNQIKLHGQRLEPEEVSAVLNKHRGVIVTAVVAAHIGESKSLVAAISPDPEYDWSLLVTELRLKAQESLPPYMVPSFWLKVDRFPMNANGKVDIRNIRAQAECSTLDEMRAPCIKRQPEVMVDGVEIQIRMAWAEVLNIQPDSISRNDSFFALGGNSMQAIRMINNLRHSGVELSLDDIFRHQNLATLREQAVVQEASTLLSANEKISLPFSMVLDEELAMSISKRPGVTDAYPVTALQESLISLTLQGSSDYLYQRVWNVKHLDLFLLKLAFQVAFMKSDILRTTFSPTNCGLMQFVRDDLRLPWKTMDISLEEYKQSDQKAGVVLGDTFWRATVLSGQILVVTMHHSLFDLWSSSFIYEDVSTLYHGLDPDPRPPFKNFVQKILRLDTTAADAFWERYLTNASPTLLNSSSAEKMLVAQKVTINLNQIATKYNVTTSTIIHVVWALILSRHLDSNDVTFASTLSGREAFVDAIDRLDGPTLTVVPRRFQLDPKATIEELLQTAHSETLQVMKYSQHGMRNALKAAGATAGLIDSMINIHPPSNGRISQQTTSIFQQFGEKETWQTEYATLEVVQDQDIVTFSLNARIEATRAEFILDQVIQTITKISHEPQTILKSLSIITKKEIEIMTAPKHFPAVPHVLQAGFEEYADSHPWRVALQWQNEELLTYRMLNRRANKLARHLQKQGLKTGDYACLLLEKSPMMIVTILAVLKVGAAYVPLSPENPIDRNAFIADDVGAKFLLSDSSIAQSAWFKKLDIILLNEVNFSQYSHTLLNTEISGDNIAYVIYTSGSTGKPKGCVLSHSAAAAGIESMIQAEGRRQGEWRALQFSNYTFDASVLDIFNTLNSGGTLCMAPNERLLSDLPEVIREMDVNHSFLTPTVARLLSSEGETLRTITIGGEPLTEDVLGLSSNSRVIQCYGPTETGMVITMRNMKPGDNPRNLGKPFDTVRVFIVEKDGTGLVPYGAIGELCIAGPQVGVGYINRPDLTAAAFCKTSLGGFTRMYRSGDLARWLPGGELECLGRKDNQVKINGHRIELGEIENAILVTEGVSQCVTLVAQIGAKPQLAAFVVFNEKHYDDEESIQPAQAHIDHVANLQEKLNGLAVYMYPKVLLPLGSMPKLPSGKSNRKLLKSWVEEMDAKDLCAYNFASFGSSALVAVIPVATEQELFLQQAFAKILNMDTNQLGQAANFLSLGGDSISAIDLCSFARKHGKLLSVRDILKFPRLRDMAGHLMDTEANETDEIHGFEAPDMREKLRESDLRLEEIEYVYACPPGQSEFLLQGKRKEQMWVLMTVRTLDVSSSTTWIEAVERLTRTNDILRTTFTEVDGKWIGVVLKSSAIVVDFINVSSEAEKRSEMDKIWNSSFIFGKPFIRYAFLSWPDGKQEVVTKMDHGLYDGTLLRVFASHFKELQHNHPAPEFTPFRDFSSRIWQSNKKAALEYWTDPSNSPTGFQFPSIKSSTIPSATTPIFVPSDLKLDTFANTCGVTVPTIFQSAFQLWLSQSSGEMDVGFDYLYTGRNIDMPNPQLINGVCANFLPLRSQIQRRTRIKDYVVSTQESFWNATDNGVVGMQDIYDAVGLQRDIHGNRSLFLFQPFEPPPVGGGVGGGDMRWVYMAGSEVKMEQPYGLVCEVIKTLTGFKIKFTVDEMVVSRHAALRGAEEVWAILGRMVEDGTGMMRVESC